MTRSTRFLFGTAMIAAWCLPAVAVPPSADPDVVTDEPITPVPMAQPAATLKQALGEQLFSDVRLSRDGNRSCNTCHDVASNGASRNVVDIAFNGTALEFNTSTVFNAALNFRLGWDGRWRTLESQIAASLQSSATMGISIEQAVAKVAADPNLVRQFHRAYGRGPDAQNLVDALATFERSLLTPNSRFDRWLMGDMTALSAQEQSGYRMFKSLGCIACHQGVNVGGNLFQRHGIFRPLVRSGPPIVRVPSLRNVGVTAPYFHDGSAPTLKDAVMRMAGSQLDSTLNDAQVEDIVAFLHTLTGTYRGRPIRAPQ